MLFLNCDDHNPYTYHKAPPIRFYNFPRRKPFSIPLSRFVVIKTDEGTTEGFVIPQKTTCQDFEFEHLPSIIYEFVTSEEIMEKEKRDNLYAFGLMMAMKKGYPVKHCVICRWFGRCVINGIQEVKNPNTNQSYKHRILLWNRSLDPKQIDRAGIAAKCKKFVLDLAKVDSLLDFFRNIPFWDWENKKAIYSQT